MGKLLLVTTVILHWSEVSAASHSDKGKRGIKIEKNCSLEKITVEAKGKEIRAFLLSLWVQLLSCEEPAYV